MSQDTALGWGWKLESKGAVLCFGSEDDGAAAMDAALGFMRLLCQGADADAKVTIIGAANLKRKDTGVLVHWVNRRKS